MAPESVQRAEAAALPNLSNLSSLSTAAAADAQTPIPELRLTRRYDDPAPPALTYKIDVKLDAGNVCRVIFRYNVMDQAVTPSDAMAENIATRSAGIDTAVRNVYAFLRNVADSMWYDRREFEDTSAIHIVPGDRYENGAIVSDAGTLWRRVFFVFDVAFGDRPIEDDDAAFETAFAQLDAAFREEHGKTDADDVPFQTKFALALSRDDFDERDFEVIDWRNSAEGEAEAADRRRSLRWPPVDEGLAATG